MLNPTRRRSLLQLPHQDPKLPDPRSKTLTPGAGPTACPLQQKGRGQKVDRLDLHPSACSIWNSLPTQPGPGGRQRSPDEILLIKSFADVLAFLG